MPIITGIELAKEIRGKTTKLVFTTGHSKYAFEAFEVHGDAYLLKPYSLSKFIVTVNGIIKDLSARKLPLISVEENDDYFFIKAIRTSDEKSKLIKILFEDVVTVESKSNYISISTKKSKFTSYMSLKEISETLLVHGQFIKPHRSFIVNQNNIIALEGNTLKMADNQEITIGKLFRDDIIHFIKKKTIKGAKN